MQSEKIDPGFKLTYPKLEQIEKDLKIFDHDVQMFVYHTLNGRYEEAESYQMSIMAEQEKMGSELKTDKEIEAVVTDISANVIDDLTEDLSNIIIKI
jgi:hypothetical protein